MYACEKEMYSKPQGLEEDSKRELSKADRTDRRVDRSPARPLPRLMSNPNVSGKDAVL